MKMFQTLSRTMGPNDTLKVKCACGHQGALTRDQAISLCGPDATPADVRSRLRPHLKCQQCHEVGKAEVWI